MRSPMKRELLTKLLCSSQHLDVWKLETFHGDLLMSEHGGLGQSSRAAGELEVNHLVR